MSTALTAPVTKNLLALLPGNALIEQRKRHIFWIVRKQMQAHALGRVCASGKHGAHERLGTKSAKASMAVRASLRRRLISCSRPSP